MSSSTTASAPSAKPRTPVSFRQLLHGAVDEFLQDQQMRCLATADAVKELIVRLAAYREEDRPLFPQIYFCDDLSAFSKHVQCRDVVVLGTGPRRGEVVREAVKKCAPLAKEGWAVWVERVQDAFNYGVFRTMDVALTMSPREMLRAGLAEDLPAFSVVQLAPNIVELLGTRVGAQLIYLSDMRQDEAPPTNAIGNLAEAAAADVDRDLREELRTFIERAMFNILQRSHGALVVVCAPNFDPMTVLQSATRLAPELDLTQRVREHRASPTVETLQAIQSAVSFIDGMMSADGITILRSDGAVLGYNAFLAAISGTTEVIGGARRRAYEGLLKHLGGDKLRAALIRSQDGRTDCARSTP